MTEGKFIPPSQTLTRRLRSLITNLDETSVDSAARQVSGWIDSFKDRDDGFRGLLRCSAELVLEKAMERPDRDLHHSLGRLCKILDTATDGEYSGFLSSSWEGEIRAVGVELLANEMAESGSWPECLALAAFAGELCVEGLLQPDALHSCIGMLGSVGSNLGLEVACTLLEATGPILCEDRPGKHCVDTTIQTMLSSSSKDGISAHTRRRVQGLGWTPSNKSPGDVQWDDETVNCGAGGPGPDAQQTVPQLCKPRHPNFYFGTGDVVFVCQDISFRVQSDLLSHNSQVFSDMLEPARLNGEHLSDGCPCVHLPDAADDFATLIKLFYTPGFPHRHKTPKFTTFSSLLRMTTKYQFQEIRSQILFDLLQAYPTELSEYKGSSCLGEKVFGSPPPHPNSVLDLFVTCKVAFALPFAYYRVCIAGDPASLDKTAGKFALPFDTLKAALRGQARLKAEEVQLARKVALQDCAAWGACSGKFPAGRVQPFNWIHPEVATQSGILEREKFQGSGYCVQCSQAFEKELSGAKKKTWENLPSYFGLSPWSEEVEKPL